MIEQTTITKAVNFLNEINSFLQKQTRITTKEIDIIAKNNHCSNDLFYFSI